MTTTILETSQGKVAVAEQGVGRPLLLLHANPGDHRDYDAVIPGLAAGHRVLAVDWPGYGDSPPPLPPASATAVSFAALGVELVDRLDLRDLVVLGNSVGGFAAVVLALARPERVARLVLIDPGGFSRPGLRTRAFCWLKGREWVTRSVALAFARRYLRRRNQPVRAILERTDRGRRNPGRVAVDAALWRSFADPGHDLRARARGLQVPTLLAWGRHDPVLPLASDGRTARQVIPGAQLVEFDTGHMPFAEDPARFLEVVLPFVTTPGRSQAA